MNGIVKFEKYNDKLVMGLIFMGVVALTFIVSAHLTFAASADPWELVENFLGNCYENLMSILNGIVIILLVIALLSRLISNNPQSKAHATNWIIGILVGWFFIVTLGAWFGWLSPQFEDNQYEFAKVRIVETEKM